MAAVMRGCRSLALMNSNVTSAPSALDASGAWRLTSTSASGMKSTQRTMCSLVPCAKAGARWVARIPAIPVSLRNDRRSIGPLLVVDDALAFVDLLEFGLRPLHGVLGRRALHALGVHVSDDVLRVRLGGLRRRGPGIAEQPRVARGRTEHLERLVQLAPHRVVLPLVGGADRIAFLRGEPLAVVLGLVQPGEEVLRELGILRILHDGVRLVEEQQIAARGPGRQRRVVDVLEQRLALVVLDLFLLPLGDDVDGRAVERGRDLAGVEGAVVVRVVPRQSALAAASFSHDFRYATALPTIECGAESHLPLTWQDGAQTS